MNQLEQMVEFTPRTTTRSIDVYVGSTAALYSGIPLVPMGPTFQAPSCQPLLPYQDSFRQTTLHEYFKPVEPMRTYDFDGGLQLHLHNDAEAGVFKYKNKLLDDDGIPRLDAYQSAMVDLSASILGFNKKDKTTNPYPFERRY